MPSCWLKHPIVVDAIFYSSHKINFNIFCGVNSSKPLQMECKRTCTFGFSVPVKMPLENKWQNDLNGFKVRKQTIIIIMVLRLN